MNSTVCWLVGTSNADIIITLTPLHPERERRGRSNELTQKKKSDLNAAKTTREKKNTFHIYKFIQFRFHLRRLPGAKWWLQMGENSKRLNSIALPNGSPKSKTDIIISYNNIPSKGKNKTYTLLPLERILGPPKRPRNFGWKAIYFSFIFFFYVPFAVRLRSPSGIVLFCATPTSTFCFSKYCLAFIFIIYFRWTCSDLHTNGFSLVVANPNYLWYETRVCFRAFFSPLFCFHFFLEPFHREWNWYGIGGSGFCIFGKWIQSHNPNEHRES